MRDALKQKKTANVFFPMIFWTVPRRNAEHKGLTLSDFNGQCMAEVSYKHIKSNCNSLRSCIPSFRTIVLLSYFMNELI